MARTRIIKKPSAADIRELLELREEIDAMEAKLDKRLAAFAGAVASATPNDGPTVSPEVRAIAALTNGSKPKRVWSAAARKKISDAAKLRWAKRKAAAASPA